MKVHFLSIISAALFFLTGLNAPAQDSQAPEKPSRHIRPAREWKRLSYTCEDGAKLNVYLHNQSARLRFNDTVHFLTQTESASGTRYSDGKILWWSKGDTGFLQAESPSGDGEMLLKNCQLDKPTNPAPAKQP